MNNLTHTYYIDFVEVIIRHEKLCLICRELPSSCTLIFAVNRQEYFKKNKKVKKKKKKTQSLIKIFLILIKKRADTKVLRSLEYNSKVLRI